MRAAVALDAAHRDEAGGLASELAGIGPALLPALNAPFPTLAEVAWLFRDLGREDDFSAVLRATPIESPWIDAANAIIQGDFVRAAETIEEMGHAAGPRTRDYAQPRHSLRKSGNQTPKRSCHGRSPFTAKSVPPHIYAWANSLSGPEVPMTDYASDSGRRLELGGTGAEMAAHPRMPNETWWVWEPLTGHISGVPEETCPPQPPAVEVRDTRRGAHFVDSKPLIPEVRYRHPRLPLDPCSGDAQPREREPARMPTKRTFMQKTECRHIRLSDRPDDAFSAESLAIALDKDGIGRRWGGKTGGHAGAVGEGEGSCGCRGVPRRARLAAGRQARRAAGFVGPYRVAGLGG